MTTRRDLLRDGAAITVLLGIAPQQVWAAARARPSVPDATLALLCDLVIPDTDTPGAVVAGAPAFVQMALELNLRGATPAAYATFRHYLDARTSGSFAAAPRAQAEALLAGIDRAVLGPRTPGQAPPLPQDPVSFWRPLKALIVMGYYSSEIGAAQELQYQLVPGAFEPDVPLSEQPRAWSSDWTGVKYA